MTKASNGADSEQLVLGAVPGAGALGRGPALEGEWSRHEYDHPAAGWCAAECGACGLWPWALCPYTGLVADYYLVEQAKGPAWDHTRQRREQVRWDEHAAFMDGLVEERFVVLGGPVGDDGEAHNVLLVVAADDEATTYARLAEDPWLGSVLRIESIRPWSVWLGAPDRLR